MFVHQVSPCPSSRRLPHMSCLPLTFWATPTECPSIYKASAQTWLHSFQGNNNISSCEECTVCIFMFLYLVIRPAFASVKTLILQTGSSLWSCVWKIGTRVTSTKKVQNLLYLMFWHCFSPERRSIQDYLVKIFSCLSDQHNAEEISILGKKT